VVSRSSKQHQKLSYARLVGAALCDDLPTELFVVGEASRLHWQSIVRSNGRKIVILIPGAARGPSKQWPLERFALLAQRLSDTGLCVVIVGSRGERASTQTMERIEGVVNLCGETGIQDLPGLMAAADAVVTNDSGGMHVAGAVGVPLVAIFGTTNPDETGPIGSNAIILQKSSYRSRAVARNCPRAISALMAITVDEVYAAVMQQLDKCAV
jgi:heptosyltransferase-2